MTKQAGFLGFLKQNAATGVATGTYNTVTQIGTVTAVGSSRALIDVSAHGDTWADFLPGRQEGTEVTLTVMWDPTITTHTNMKADYDSVAVAIRYYELQHPELGLGVSLPGDHLPVGGRGDRRRRDGSSHHVQDHHAWREFGYT